MDSQEAMRQRNRSSFISTKRCLLIITAVSCIAYMNVISAPLLYDDTAAVLNNPDVQEITDISDIWSHDFWGYPMTSSGSHKSYRPITVLLFRYLHSQYKNWSPAYHVTNIILHAIVSVLFFFICQRLVFSPLKETAPLVAGLLFALHPIHTEAVCGAVGCAEILSGVCFMLSLLAYSFPFAEINSTPDLTYSGIKPDKVGKYKNDAKNNGNLKHRKVTKNSAKSKESNKYQRTSANIRNTEKDVGMQEYSYPATIISLMLATVAMLCKESGMTVLGVLVIYELIRSQSRKLKTKSTILKIFDADFIKKSSIILIWGVLLVLFRLWIMGFGKPTYTIYENPASYAEERLTRILTYFYLAWMNFYLLLLPINLSYDYSVGTVPLISSLWDTRNIISLVFLLLCVGSAIAIIRCLKNKAEWSRGYLLGCSIMVFTFIPASNLLFPVGFVIAERILYLPSAGFILLLVLLWSEAMEKFWSIKKWLQAAMSIFICFYFFQTVSRNFVWTSKERLFKSGLEVYPHNAKIRYNWGNFLQKQNLYNEALAEYQQVIELQPDYFSALNNMGSMHEVLNHPKELVEEMYSKAIKAEPQNEIGYANLARIYVNQMRTKEAIQVLRRALNDIKHSSPLDKGMEVVRNLIKQDPSPQAYEVHYALLKRACLQVDHPSRARQCANTVVPELQALSDWFKQRGEKKKLSKIYNQIADINALKPDAMKRLVQALSVSNSTEEVSNKMASYHTQKPTKPLLEASSETNLWNRAIAMFQNQRFEESRALYEAYMKENPQNLEAKGQYL